MKDIIRKILREEIIFESPKRLTTQEFIERAQKKHGDKYDYSNSVYIGLNKPVKIFCPIEGHGEFIQRADAHMSGQGCPICGRIKNTENLKLTTDEFIQRAKLAHGNKYDYSQSVYTDSSGKVKIICSEHGPFYQNAYNHMRGSGCNKCAGRDMLDTLDFIRKSKEIYGNDKFDYSEVNYIDAHTKVGIICPKPNHGLFTVSPANHINNQSGCPICNESKGERLVAKILTNNKIDYVRGKTFKDCVGTGKKFCRVLPFDFYLPYFNTMIEYDGRQHSEPVKEFGGQQGHEKTKIHDKIKDEYCKKNNIRMIRIPYTTKDSDVESFIKKHLGITS
jgi:hypothetical protein